MAGTETNAVESDILSENLWPGFDKFKAVQVLLDRNKILIDEISDAHAARDAGGAAKALSLLRELNQNVAKAQTLYEAAGSAFSVSVSVDSGGGHVVDARTVTPQTGETE